MLGAFDSVARPRFGLLPECGNEHLAAGLGSPPNLVDLDLRGQRPSSAGALIQRAAEIQQAVVGIGQLASCVDLVAQLVLQFLEQYLVPLEPPMADRLDS